MKRVGPIALLLALMVAGFYGSSPSNQAQSESSNPSADPVVPDWGVVNVMEWSSRLIDVDAGQEFWLALPDDSLAKHAVIELDGFSGRVQLQPGDFLPVTYEQPGTYTIRVWDDRGVALTPFTVRVFGPPEGHVAWVAGQSLGESSLMSEGGTLTRCSVGSVYAGSYVTNTVDRYPIRITADGSGTCTLVQYGGSWSRSYQFDQAGEKSDVVDVPAGQMWTILISYGGVQTLSPNNPNRLVLNDLILTNGPSYTPLGQSVTNRVWQLQGGRSGDVVCVAGSELGDEQSAECGGGI